MRACPSCGAANDPDTMFCRLCGAACAPSPAAASGTMRPDIFQLFKSRATVAMALAVAGMALCGPVTAIPAIVIANQEMKKELPRREAEMARAAYWVALADLAFWLIGLVIVAYVYIPSLRRL